MKRLLAIGFSVVMVLTLAACGNNESHTTEIQTEEAAEDNSIEETNSEPETGSNVGNTKSGNVLIAYFSHTGNTKEAAELIAGHTGGDLAEIKRTEEYEDLNTEAEDEINEGARPEITVSVDNVSAYDTIFVGYPIWFDEAPAMIATFLESYDFDGKTIVPFCTSSSDTIDNSLHIFKELCPDAVIAEGLTANDTEDIEPWLNELGFGQR